MLCARKNWRNFLSLTIIFLPFLSQQSEELKSFFDEFTITISLWFKILWTITIWLLLQWVHSWEMIMFGIIEMQLLPWSSILNYNTLNMLTYGSKITTLFNSALFKFIQGAVKNISLCNIHLQTILRVTIFKEALFKMFVLTVFVLDS